MHVAHLALANVRSFRHLSIDLAPGITVIAGVNGAGKTNLLEAIEMLATTRGRRAGPDLEVIEWDALAGELMPAARIEADVRTASGPRTLEVAVIASTTVPGVPATRASKRFRVNGIARRASDLIGQLRVVTFAVDDLTIIDGAPANRRRYLDLTISQLDPAYLRALQRYARVLEQRNSLLRRLQERRSRALDQLEFWDDELAAAGALILARRDETVRALAEDAALRYTELVVDSDGDSERLEIRYEPGVPPDVAAALREHDLQARLRAAFEAGRPGDVQRGVTRIGPHRDDLRFLIDGHSAGASASRGQQRSAALALRLAEVALSTKRTGDPPVLLLDDILSELDAGRRARILGAAYGVDQVLITTPDEERPGHDVLPGARRYRLEGGELIALTPSPLAGEGRGGGVSGTPPPIAD